MAVTLTVKFCPNCGFKLTGEEKTCPNCGIDLTPYRQGEPDEKDKPLNINALVANPMRVGMGRDRGEHTESGLWRWLKRKLNRK